MRTMEIPKFPASARMQVADLGPFIQSRLLDDVVMWPEQALALVGYMSWPNDPVARRQWLEANRSQDRQSVQDALSGYSIIQQHWARVADIVHHHFDLTRGRHQERRGGPSVAKAIHLVATGAQSKGTGASKLWEIWKAYKDAAHLITTAVLVSGEAQRRHRRAPYGLRLHELQPYRMAMLLSDPVLAVAMTIETYGLESVAHSRSEPMFDPESLWRIPPDINLEPIEFPARRMGSAAIQSLRERRSGNRGKVNRPIKTTPVFA